MATQKKRSRSGSYGIAEWYGRLYGSLTNEERFAYTSSNNKNIPCRFMRSTPLLAPKGGTNCNKKSGVCSIRNFTDSPNGVEFGPITATCPFRFLDDGLIVREIGKALLGTETPRIAKEIPFLKRTVTEALSDSGDSEGADSSDIKDDADPGLAKEDVGRIDLVCVHPELNPFNWCAVEMQAVYFSGGALSKDFAQIRSYAGNGVPLPGAGRRPDFRSSGPKRLMPQLQIKVPTLRRWGKKMAVVIDKPFFDSLGQMDHVADVSNSDIAWVVVKFVEPESGGLAKMEVHEIKFTTLERAVEGLTAGVPATLPEFEQKIRSKLRS